MRKVEFVPFRLTEEVDIYSIRIDGKHETEFHEFLITFKGNNDPYLADDLERILRTLSRISAEGLSDSLFRPEGKLEDRVFALPLYIAPRNKKRHGTLRLYCIKVSDKILIIGGGGNKRTDTYEQDPILSDRVLTLQEIDKELRRLEDRGTDLYNEINNLTINIYGKGILQ